MILGAARRHGVLKIVRCVNSGYASPAAAPAPSAGVKPCTSRPLISLWKGAPRATESFIPGNDASLESTIRAMQAKPAARGFHVQETSWLNPIENIRSVHIKDRDCPLLFSNGKGASELASRASALGEFFERPGCHYLFVVA